MGAVTYPDPTVVTFVQEGFVPVHLLVKERADALAPFTPFWTPALYVLDGDGHQHRRAFGWHSPRDLIAELALAATEEAIFREDWPEAGQRVTAAVERCRGDAEREPEARYLKGIVAYKSTGDVERLKAAWSDLLDAFPASSWARKASIIKG